MLEEKNSSNIKKLDSLIKAHGFDSLWCLRYSKSKKPESVPNIPNKSISNDGLIDNTNETYEKKTKIVCKPLEEALAAKDKLNSLSNLVNGVMLNMAALPTNFVILDFDGVGEDTDLPELWSKRLEGAAVERSNSGKGFHACFVLPDDVAGLLKHSDGSGTFKLDDDTFCTKGGKIDCFTGGINRSIHITGKSVVNWQSLNDLYLSDEALELMTQWVKSTVKSPESKGLGHRALVQGHDTGGMNAEQVIKAMKQRSYLKGVQGGLIKLMNGDKDFIEEHYSGDWSSADLSLACRASEYTQDYDVLLDVMLNCEITARKKGSYQGSNPNKWEREDYIRETLNKALDYRAKAQDTVGQETFACSKDLIDKPYFNDLQTKQTGKGKVTILSNLSNLTTILKHDEMFKGMFAFSDLSGMVEVQKTLEGCSENEFPTGVFTGEHGSFIRMRLEALGLEIKSTSSVGEAVQVTAKGQYISPLKDRFSELEGAWDGQDRFSPEFIKEHFFKFDCSAFPDENTEEFERLQCLLFKKWLAQVVGRCERRGTKAEGFLILEGGQGLGKTRLVNTLAAWWDKPLWNAMVEEVGEDFKQAENYLANHSSKLVMTIPHCEIEYFNNRDYTLRRRGKLFFFIDEMKGLEKKHTELVKGYVSGQCDNTREMYQNHSIDIERLGLFIGAFNADLDLQASGRILNDTTGSRRYWLLRVKSIDMTQVVKNLPQLWAQVWAEMQENSLMSQLNEAELELNAKWLRQFQPFDAWADLVDKFLTEDRETGYRRKFAMGGFTTDELSDAILNHMEMRETAIQLGYTGSTPTVAKIRSKVGNALRDLGYTQMSEVSFRSGGTKGSRKVWEK